MSSLSIDLLTLLERAKKLEEEVMAKDARIAALEGENGDLLDDIAELRLELAERPTLQAPALSAAPAEIPS